MCVCQEICTEWSHTVTYAQLLWALHSSLLNKIPSNRHKGPQTDDANTDDLRYQRLDMGHYDMPRGQVCAEVIAQ